MDGHASFARVAALASATLLLSLFARPAAAQPQRGGEGVRRDEMSDLVAVALTPSVAFPAPGETVDVTVRVRNRAPRAERGVVVALSAGRAHVAEKAVDFNPGETVDVRLSWRAGPEGELTLTARVDPGFRLVEHERGDNLITADLAVARQPSGEVDLALVGLEPVRAADQTTILRARVRNNGTVAARAPLVVRADGLIAHVRLPLVAAGETVTVELPLGVAPAQLSAEINPRFRSVERRPADNFIFRNLLAAVDLRVEGLSIYAERFDRSRPRQVTISFRVVNAGSAAVGRAFRTGISPGGVRPGAAPPFAAHGVTTGGLPPGGTAYVSHTVVSTAAEFEVRVQADADNVVAEIDELNNLAASPFKNLTPGVGRWVSIGPRRINAGGGLGSVGRLSTIAVHPTQPSTLYVGGGDCGVWKTTNLGASWQPVADSLPTLKIGALAIDPSAPSRVYAATGDKGVFRSEDGGTSWTQLPGSPGTEIYTAVFIVHPTDRNVLFMTTRSGVMRSRDFGATWQLVRGGAWATDLVIDPRTPSTLYAARRGVGVEKTTDGGDTWGLLTNGLPAPASNVLQITLAIVRNSPANLYAGFTVQRQIAPGSMVNELKLFRTADAGATWQPQTAPADTTLFNNVLGVDFADPHFVYPAGIQLYRRVASSQGFVAVSGPHADHHGFASDPNTFSTYSLNDGGIYRSTDRGVSWSFIGDGIANAEFYDHAVAFRDPNLVIGGTQDNGTIRFDGASTAWTIIRGGDGATVDIDPANSQTRYTMNQGQDSMSRDGNVLPGCIGCSLPVKELCFNLHFQVHPNSPSTLLASCVSLWRSVNPQCPQCPDRGNNFGGTPGVWTPILTQSQVGGGEIRVLRSAVDRATDIYYAGTSQGEVWAGPSGANWQKVFAARAAADVTDIEVDLDDPPIAYVSLAGGGAQRVLRLRRLSATPTAATTVAQDITSNLPSGLSVKTLAVDRLQPFTVYAGTNNGVFRAGSPDRGATWSWTPYSDGMPAATDVRDLEVHPVTGVMRAATFGRSAFEVNTDAPVGSLQSAAGKLTLLRAHDEGSGFGPPHDPVEGEIIVALDTQPGKFFGFQLRADANQRARRAMFNLLRDAFARERRVQIDYIRTGARGGSILRVAPVP